MASILLVEDAPEIREMVELLLHNAGHKVLSVSDGISALDWAARDQPNLIIMDLALPQLNGWDATRQLKANRATQHIPVLAFTAHVFPDELERALLAGCAAITTKPFDINEFLRQIDRLLQDPSQPIRQRTVGMADEAE